MLSAADLADMGSDLNTSLPDQATIRRPAQPPTVDQYSSATETWGTVVVVNCRISPPNRLTPVERQMGGELVSEQREILTLPAGTDLRPIDQVDVLFRIPNVTVRFEVIAVFGPRSYEISRRALVQRQA